MEGKFEVKTEVFQGPLELLLDLIERRKLLINDISLAKVADDFIGYVNSHENFPISESAAFILVASTLVLIKSKSLLPQLKLTDEEQQSIEELEARLKTYERIRALSRHIAERFGKKIIFEPANRFFPVVFSPDDSMTLETLRAAMRETLTRLPQKEHLPKAVVEKVISLEEMISNLTVRIKSSLKMSFREFSGTRSDKVSLIVSFLAMLELVKQGIINVEQQARFGDINMETETLDVPAYL